MTLKMRKVLQLNLYLSRSELFYIFVMDVSIFLHIGIHVCTVIEILFRVIRSRFIARPEAVYRTRLWSAGETLVGRPIARLPLT